MDKIYSTQSIYEGAFLLARGCELAGKEDLGNKISLLFKDNTKTQLEALNFYNSGLVEGKKYSDCYRTLKDYIFKR
jgi:hypothetical protein